MRVEVILMLYTIVIANDLVVVQRFIKQRIEVAQPLHIDSKHHGSNVYHYDIHR